MLGTQIFRCCSFPRSSMIVNLTQCAETLSSRDIGNAARNASCLTVNALARLAPTSSTCCLTASLKMVLGCILAGLANHALHMHRLAPSEGHHAVLGLTGRFCHTASHCLLEHVLKTESSNCVERSSARMSNVYTSAHTSSKPRLIVSMRIAHSPYG